MSVMVSNLIWDRMPTESQGDLLVCLALADWSNDDGLSWPAVKKLAAKCRMSERNARYVLASLRANGLLSFQDNKGGKGKSNRYVLNVERLQGLPSIVDRTLQPLPSIVPKTLQPLQPSNHANHETVAVLEAKPCNLNTANPAIAIADNPSVEPSEEQRVPRKRGSLAKSDKEQEPSEHRDFIASWCECFEAQWGSRYSFQGGRDAKAVKTLLESTGKSATEILGVATKAWSSTGLSQFLRDQAMTIHGLAAQWNQIAPRAILSPEHMAAYVSAKPKQPEGTWGITKRIEACEEEMAKLRKVHATEEIGEFRWPKEKSPEVEKAFLRCRKLKETVEGLRASLRGEAQ